MTVPRCLVLLAAYKGELHIKEQLESILSQQGVDLTILVGDDASPDATVSIAGKLDHLGRVQVRPYNSGSGSAAQNFIRLIGEADSSDFDYVALSDQDDIWMQDKLRRATHMLAHSGAGGYSSSVIARWSDGKERVLRQSSKARAADFLFEGAGQGCTFVLTRVLFQKMQMHLAAKPHVARQLIYHDWAIYALARCLDERWIFDDRPSLWYRQHAGNDTGARLSLAGLKKRLQLLRNRQYRAQVRAISELCTDLVSTIAPVQEWIRLDAGGDGIHQRLGKAALSLRHGRRRRLDRILTTLAILANWV